MVGCLPATYCLEYYTIFSLNCQYKICKYYVCLKESVEIGYFRYLYLLPEAEPRIKAFIKTYKKMKHTAKITDAINTLLCEISLIFAKV